jgi:hypothetical protein
MNKYKSLTLVCSHIFFFTSFFPYLFPPKKKLHIRFSLKSLESNQDTLRAAVILKDKLDFNERMIYQLLLLASVSTEYIYTVRGSGVFATRVAVAN